MPWHWIDADDALAWDSALDLVGGADVYYERPYVRALERRGEGRALLLCMTFANFTSVHVAMRRALPLDSVGSCDLITPYGYGGPLVSNPSASAAYDVDASWREAAADMGAVSEFVRFHPVLDTSQFVGSENLSHVSDTVLWDLTVSDLTGGMSSTCRKNLRWAEKKGVTTSFEEVTAVNAFATLYRDTMKRRGARDYYLFDDDYFRDLVEGFGNRLWVALARVEDRIAAAALIMQNKSGDTIHYHLGASDWDLRASCATNKLLYDAALRARESGVRRFHLGGGTSRDDSLFGFKAGFSPTRRPFYVGKRIYRADAYNALTRRRAESGPMVVDFFPAYRSPLPAGAAS